MDYPTVVIDFDGVIHNYGRGWSNATTIPNQPVPGAMKFLQELTKGAIVAIYSSRSAEFGGIYAMKTWLESNLRNSISDAERVISMLSYPVNKPRKYVVYLDDKSITFNGTFPHPRALLTFKPWHKGKF